MATTKRTSTRAARDSYCICCAKMKPITEFYISSNPFHKNGVVPYCRACCKTLCDTRLEQTQSLESAIWLTCAEMGVPFIKAAFDATEQRMKDKKDESVNARGGFHYFGIYIASLCNYAKEKKSEQYTDFRQTDVPLGEIKTLRQAEQIIEKEKDNLRLIWGDKSVDDLQYLEYRYTTYTKDVQLTEYQSGLYRDLCLAELEIYQADNIDGATKRKQQIGKALGLDQFMIDKEKTEFEKSLEYQIFEMEQKMPCEIYDQPTLYKDFCGIKAYWDINIMRPLRNLLAGTKDYPKVSKE